MQSELTIYYKPLNGLRGLAAILILLVHSLFPCFKALWIGVPIFFVLSGFLITRILLLNKTSENYFKAFYFKRALRIFPIYYLALLFSVFWGLAVKADFNHFPLFLIYLQNFPISQNNSPDYCYGLMNHTWSLSVEELFYLFWPLLVFILQKRTLVWVTLLIGLASILFKLVMLCFFYTEHTDQLLLLSLAGNIDGLMAGALLGILSLDSTSFLYRPFPLKTFYFALLFFCLVLAANYHTYSEIFHFSLVKNLLSLCVIAFTFFAIAWVITHQNSSSLFLRPFNSRLLQFAGTISYGLYLYHAIVYGITEAFVYHFKISFGSVPLLFFKILITLLISILSWRFIEQPFLRLKNKIPYKKTL